MPLWKIYHPVDAFSAADKQDLAADITKLYVEAGLPPFYVSVLFQAIPKESFFIGGEPVNNFVRVWIDHIARHLNTPEEQEQCLALANGALAPYVRDRGLNWEFHIDETPFELWSIQGYRPPLVDTEDYRRWFRENKASPLVGDAA